MSSLWLALSLVGTFLTIFLVGVIVDMFMREKNRPMTILQSQLGPVEAVDLRQEELKGSMLDRVFMPAAKGMGRGLIRLTPLDLNARINELLVMAGNPPGWDAERVVALKIIGGVAGAVLGSMLMTMVPLPALVKLLMVAVFVLLGYTIPSAQVRAMANKRQKGIQRQLSDVMDLLTISVEAGLGLDAAVAQVVK
ncbi:MAG: hypothetical protein ACRDHU_14075, partial [Actinomycetota bacterium]